MVFYLLINLLMSRHLIMTWLDVSVFVDTTVLFSIIFCVDLAVYEEQDVR